MFMKKDSKQIINRFFFFLYLIIVVFQISNYFINIINDLSYGRSFIII